MLSNAKEKLQNIEASASEALAFIGRIIFTQKSKNEHFRIRRAKLHNTIYILTKLRRNYNRITSIHMFDNGIEEQHILFMGFPLTNGQHTDLIPVNVGSTMWPNSKVDTWIKIHDVIIKKKYTGKEKFTFPDWIKYVVPQKSKNGWYSLKFTETSSQSEYSNPCEDRVNSVMSLDNADKEKKLLELIEMKSYYPYSETDLKFLLDQKHALVTESLIGGSNGVENDINKYAISFTSTFQNNIAASDATVITFYEKYKLLIQYFGFFDVTEIQEISWYTEQQELYRIFYILSSQNKINDATIFTVPLRTIQVYTTQEAKVLSCIASRIASINVSRKNIRNSIRQYISVLDIIEYTIVDLEMPRKDCLYILSRLIFNKKLVMDAPGKLLFQNKNHLNLHTSALQSENKNTEYMGHAYTLDGVEFNNNRKKIENRKLKYRKIIPDIFLDSLIFTNHQTDCIVDLFLDFQIDLEDKLRNSSQILQDSISLLSQTLSKIKCNRDNGDQMQTTIKSIAFVSRYVNCSNSKKKIDTSLSIATSFIINLSGKWDVSNVELTQIQKTTPALLKTSSLKRKRNGCEYSSKKAKI